LTPTYVQGNSSDPQSSPSSVTLSYPSAQTAGDLNVVAVGWNDTSASIASVADSAGNSYQVAVPLSRANGMSQALYYAKNIGGGTTTLTVTFTQGAAYPDIRILEYRNLDPTAPFDVGTSGAGSAATASSGSVTTAGASELLVGAGMTQGLFSGAGSGYTKRIITSPDGDLVEDRVAPTAGSYAATGPVSGAWLMQLAAFRPAPGP
jgi:hypothetical protein